MDIQHLTPTQRRLVAMLSDGHRHPVRQLRTCLNDELATIDTLQKHINALREKLRPYGSDVAMVRLSDGTYYQLVNLIQSQSAG